MAIQRNPKLKQKGKIFECQRRKWGKEMKDWKKRGIGGEERWWKSHDNLKSLENDLGKG